MTDPASERVFGMSFYEHLALNPPVVEWAIPTAGEPKDGFRFWDTVTMDLIMLAAFGSRSGRVRTRSEPSAARQRQTVTETMLRRLVAPVAFFLALGGCVGATSGPFIKTTTYGVSEQIPVTVSKPDGPGPFPAVVIMHDCSGVGPTSSGAPGRWAREFVARGYVVVIPDSFTSRGHAGGVCTVALSQRRSDVRPDRRAHDAYAAVAYARTLSYVDGRRVGIMGGSHGGTTTLAAMMAPERDTEPLAREKRAGFAAAVALYPRCAAFPAVYRPVAPLLILIGEKDDWTPAEPCRKLVEASGAVGDPVAIKVYPGAHHSFDSPNPVRYVAARINPNSPGGRGATTAGDPAAWADSIREVTAFFGQHIMQTKELR